MPKFLVILFTLWLMPAGIDQADAKEYPIFDGQKYNGLFYPRVDIIEWTHKGQAPHLEFHIYSKEEPIEIEAKPILRGGNRVLLVNYFFGKRKEKVCRSVIAPASFGPDTKLYFYKDKSDGEYDNIYVSVNPKPTTNNIETYPAKSFDESGCEEATADSGNKSGASSQSGTGANSAGRDVASSGGNKAPGTLTDTQEGFVTPHTSGGVGGTKPADEKKHELIDYDNNAMPYNF